MTFIEVIDTETQNASQGKVYHVLVNPASYSVQHAACFATEQPMGGSEPSPTFNKILPGSLNIDLLFDATGSLGISTLNPSAGIMDQVKEFLEMVFEVDKKQKQPKPLYIIWGPMEFYGRATSINLSYSHFDAYGQPIRAIAKCSFIQDKGIKRKESKATSAPDALQEKIDFNQEKHLVNGLLKHGPYLKVLGKQIAKDLPNTLRQIPENLDLFI